VAFRKPFGGGRTSAEDIAEMYVQYRTLLLFVAARKFRVPEEECESILQDAFLALLETLALVENPRAWLVAAVCNGSRHYWRTRSRLDEFDAAKEEDLFPDAAVLNVERLEGEILVRDILRRLCERERTVLRLHYFEHRTAAELAEHLGTTTGYAEKLIVKALKRARELFASRHATPSSEEPEAISFME
jgi:RNA polymerase sigma factor (sigma-70 family)